MEVRLYNFYVENQTIDPITLGLFYIGTVQRLKCYCVLFNEITFSDCVQMKSIKNKQAKRE
jgi:hypothetical protein